MSCGPNYGEGGIKGLCKNLSYLQKDNSTGCRNRKVRTDKGEDGVQKERDEQEEGEEDGGNTRVVFPLLN